MDFHKARFRKSSKYSKYINSESRDRGSKNQSRRTRDAGLKIHMHDAICGKCGTACKIPFEPRQGRSVFCSDCFRKVKSRDDRRKRGKSPRRDKREKTRDTYFIKKKDYEISSDTFYVNLREKLFDILGGKKCANCGFTDERALGFSDIDDSRVFDIIRRGGSVSSWEKYISNPDLARKKLQILCLNCNQTK